MKEKLKKHVENVKGFFSKEDKSTTMLRRFWIVGISIILIVIAIFTGLVAYAETFSGRVMPGVHIDGTSIGGMRADELKDFLNAMNDKLIDQGIQFTFTYNGSTDSLTIYPVIVTGSNSKDIVTIDIEDEVARLIAYDKKPTVMGRIVSTIDHRMRPREVTLESVWVDEEEILESINDHIGDQETDPRNAGVKITSTDPLEYEVTSSSPGVIFITDDVVEQIERDWSRLRAPDITLTREMVEPTIVEDDVARIDDRLDNVFDDGALTLTHTDPQTEQSYSWVITVNDISEWIEIQRTDEDRLVFGLHEDSVKTFLDEEIADSVNAEARDAKFEVSEDGKVTEFQGSRPGTKLEIDGTYTAINEAIIQRTQHDEGISQTLDVVVEQVEPNIKTGEINELGISEVLGVGYSNFSGSPSNRVHNIRNAINKLNGVLVPPGEEFSTIQHTQPFTLAGGYLPELVIKGDEIKPEIGGGLCQIGSTLFRMAMNSGLEITERRNHSLVVNYYNDPTNGLPGTDATIYDPAPDFRFKNDTNNYILVQGEMNPSTGDLTFILWGTNDGRDGYYTKPQVSRWIPHGETKEIPTTKLAPGVRECQSAYTGAEASFTYIRELPNGEREERVFESYYRPLPQICLVGVAEDGATCDPTDEDCVIESSEVPLSEAEQDPDGIPAEPIE